MGEDPAANMFPTSLPKQFLAREGEAPAEPLHRWFGRSLALPRVFKGAARAHHPIEKNQPLLPIHPIVTIVMSPMLQMSEVVARFASYRHA